jgi:outer membrane protein assembly factor BamB
MTGLKADLSGAAFSPSICQPRVVIEVTDGRGNIPADVPGDEYVKLVEKRVSDLGAAGVSTVGVGFGLGPEGDVRAQVQRLAKVANEAGNANPSDMVYPLHAEDDQGVGLPYYADDKNGLLDAFRTIMSGVKRAVFYGSAPAVHSATDLGDVVLVSSFNPLGWTGDLEAFGKVNGAWSVARWKASERVPASRKVFTVNHFDQVTPYTDATLTGDNYLCKDLGDIVNSVPVVVGPPPFYYTFDGYSAFKRSRGLAAPRDTLVYVGSNDGLLHAFDLSDGSEKWAFLPRSLHAKLELAGNGGSYDPCSPKYCHQSMLDGSPQVADVYANFGAAGKQWRTILVTGERGGGTAYTALDVTSGEAFDHPTDPARFLWEFTDPGLGESWADPQIERVADPPNGASAAVWGVFLSSGYAQNESQQAKKEAKVYGLEADTGLPLWSDGTNPVSQVTLLKTELVIGYWTTHNGSPNMLFFEPGEILIGLSSGTAARVLKNEPTAAMTANVHLVDVEGPFYPNERILGNLGSLGTISSIQTLGDPPQLNNALNSAMVANFSPSDHIADAMYVGDLYGTMFRVDDIGKGQTPKVSKLFRFSPYPASPDVHPIRGKATYARGAAADTIWVYWGTGRYETEADKISKTTQYFLGVKDSKTARTTPLTPEYLRMRQARFSELTVGGKTQKVRTIEGDELSGYSWALELFSGQSGWGGPAAFGGSERVFTRPLAAGGVVFFTSFIPDASSCTGSGDTWLYALDYASGREPGFPVFDLNGDGKFNDADKVTVNGQKRVPVGIYVGRGQGSQPVLFKDTVFVTTAVAQKQSLGEAGGALHAIDVNLPDLKIRVESWKHD